MHRHIKWIPLVLIVIILIAAIIYLIVNLRSGHKLPCNYLDSINITDGKLQPDSSIIFNDITYPKDQYFDINYILQNGSKTHINVNSTYRRGCLCNIKPCIRLCCPAGVFYNNVKFKCQRHANELAKHLEHDVLDQYKVSYIPKSIHVIPILNKISLHNKENNIYSHLIFNEYSNFN